MNIRESLRKLVRGSPTQVSRTAPLIISLLSILFGIFGGEVLHDLQPNWFAPENRANLVFVIVSISAIVTVLFMFRLWQTSIDYTRSLYEAALIGIEEADHKPYKEAYKWLTHQIQHAHKEVILFTYFTYDPKAKRKDYEAERMISAERKAMFEALKQIIGQGKIEYVRIFQIPNGFDKTTFKDILVEDKMYEEECKLIVSHYQALDRDAKMRLIFTPFITHMSFVLIDRKHLFLNLDIYDWRTQKYSSPYIFVAEDKSNHERFSSLWKLVDYVRDQGVVQSL